MAIVVLAIPCGSLLIPLNWGVWLPDILSGKTVVFGDMRTGGGDHLRLIQMWVGDGYATEFLHTDNHQRTWLFAVDGDAPRAWSGRLEKSNALYVISILDQRFYYNIRSNSIWDDKGRSQLIMEVPPGTPLDPPR